LFPYLKHWKTGDLFPNPHLEEWERAHHIATTAGTRGRRGRRMDGPSLTEIPSGLVSAPVKVIDIRSGIEHMMRLRTLQDETPSRPAPDGARGWHTVDVNVG